MTDVLAIVWVLCALPILFEQKILKMAIYLGIYSLVTSIIFLVFGAPDVALAEAAISIFSTIFFVTCFEKYYSIADKFKKLKPTRYIIPGIFSAFLMFLFLRHVPDVEPNTYLMEQYLNNFATDVGGTNAVTSIYLGYRLYDTVFEALMLMVSVIAIAHVSWHHAPPLKNKSSHIELTAQAKYIIRLISTLFPLFGIYLIVNGHTSPGGGFQGGVAVAAFFVCRYMTYTIHDLPIERLLKGEKLVFASIVVLSVFVIFLGVHQNLANQPFLQTLYLILMNTLIGVKVALGFIMLFYRFIAVERQ